MCQNRLSVKSSNFSLLLQEHHLCSVTNNPLCFLLIHIGATFSNSLPAFLLLLQPSCHQALGRVLLVLNVLHVSMMEAAVLLGTFREAMLSNNSFQILIKSCLCRKQTLGMRDHIQ